MNREMKNTGIPYIGTIPSEWKIIPIKAQYMFYTGFTPPSGQDEHYDPDGETWITIADMKKDVTAESEKHITKSYAEQKGKKIPMGSLLYSFKLSVGKTSVLGCDAYTNEAIAAFPSDKNPCIEYLRYSSMFIEGNANENIYGAKILNQQLINNAPVPYPPISEQRAIASYLDAKCSAIDEAIERHEKIIEKLEEYRTKVVSHAVMHGLTSGAEEKRYPVIELCPSHWKVSRLKFSANVVRGGSPRPIDSYITDKNGLNWIKIGDATGNGKYINSAKQQIIPEGLSKTRLVHPGTLLLTNSMSFGHPYILNIDGCIHDGWLAFSDYDGIEQDYLYYYLMSDSAMNQFVRTVEGSVVNNLNIEKVKNSLITIPPIGEQKEIVAYLDKQNTIINDAIRTKEAIVTKLEEYRKSIIYNAVTGKIDCRTEAVE